MTLRGSCHCDRVHWTFEGMPEVPLPATAPCAAATECSGSTTTKVKASGSPGRPGLRARRGPQAVARVPIDHFDGLDRFEDLPRDGKCVADYWF